VFAGATVRAFDLGLPTANDALLRPGAEAEFFQPTVEGTTESGMFGCVRSHGYRVHKGIDIKCLQRDRQGEPIDPVHAAADGEVAFVNAKPGLSNFGRYIVIQHVWDGVQVCTLYAHLREIAAGISAGQPVKKGQVIATLGHSANTREGISRDRAHLHFEIDLLLNPNFYIWYPKHVPDAPPFGNFNGQNLIGMDAAAVLRAYAANRKMNFAEYVSKQPIAFTVLVGGRPFPWLRLHPEQVQPAHGPTLAYEIGMTAWGLPVAVWPRSAEEVGESQRHMLERSVPVLARTDDAELSRWTCGELVKRRGEGWSLTEHGREWLQEITFVP
jgi:murein DD-endopeptidase MepM/ murein hydrolase activator NlpD